MADVFEVFGRRGQAAQRAIDALLDAHAQLTLARSLFGRVVRFAHEPDSCGYLVVAVTGDGMVELKGWTGHFAPHLFVRVDEKHAARVDGVPEGAHGDLPRRASR